MSSGSPGSAGPSGSSSADAPADAPLTRTFVTIIVVEIACIGALYWLGVYFG
jgi:hypothetical protein